MFYFRINKLKIKDNRELPKYLLFGPDIAQVKLFSFITTTDTVLPDIDELLSSTNESKQRELCKNAIRNVASSRILTTIDNVKDNAVMTFGDTGYVLYRAKEIPEDFNWAIIAIESDTNVRTFGNKMKSVIDDEKFDGFATDLLKMIGNVTNPSYIAGVAISKFIIKVIAENLKKDKDDLIGILYMSLNRREHYLHGERKADDISDLTNNMLIDYSIFAY